MSEVMVIACYRPKRGKDDELLALVKTHLPILREQGLVGDGPSLAGRAKDGTIVEVFCWKSEAAIASAHENAAVAKMWEAYGKLCDFTAISKVEGASDLFTPLEPLTLS